MRNKALLKIIAVYQILGGCILLPFTLASFFKQDTAFFYLLNLIFTLFAILSIVAGAFLWSIHKKSIQISAVVQSLQLLVLNIPGFITYSFYMGINLLFMSNLSSGRINISTNQGATYSFGLGDTVSGPITFGINIIPLVLLMYFSTVNNKNKSALNKKRL